MSVVVMAYHEMGCTGLRVLIERKADVAAVFTYKDHPGESIWFGSVEALARRHGIPAFTTEDINGPEWIERVRSFRPDVIFSFYYRHMLKRAIRAVPRHGCVNLHGSLLPRYRGRCPVNWQLVNGETESGVTLHYIVARADAGDIIGQERVEVGPDDTALDLYRKLLPAAQKVLADHLEDVLHGTAPRIPQDDSAATVFGGRAPEDGRFEWTWPAARIHNLVRAVAPPWPGAFCETPAGPVMVYRSRPHPSVSPLPRGRVRVEGERTFVGTGSGVLELIEYAAPENYVLRTGDALAFSRER